MSNIPDVKIRLLVENGQMKVGFGDASKAVQQFAAQTGSQAGAAGAALDTLTGKVNQLESGLDTVKELGATFLSFAGLKAMVGTLVQNQIAFDQIRNTLAAATGSARKGAEEFAYLESVAERTGVRIAQVGDIYAGYMAAARQANLTTAETRDLFESVAEAGAVFGLSTTRMNSTMIALQQMMGMGVIKSQELRYQLGSALPGAFTAFKKLVEEEGIDFNEQMAKGFDVKQYAPKLAEAIRNLYSEEDVAKAANDLQSQISKMVNAIGLFKESMSRGPFSEAIGFLIDSVTRLVQGLTGGENAFAQWSLVAVTAGVALGTLSKAANMVYDRFAMVGTAMRAQVTGSQAVATATATQTAATRNLILTKQAELLATQAAIRSKQAELVLAIQSSQIKVAEARQNLQVAQSKGASAVASGELAAAEARLTAAEARLTAQRMQLIATSRAKVAINRQVAASTLAVAGATTTAGNAATASAAKMSAATIASRGMATAGRTVLGVLGGWPGVIFAAVAALTIFISKQSEAERQTQALISKLSEARQAMASFAGNWKDLAAARQVYADALKSGNEDDIRDAEEALRVAQQAMLEGRSAAKISAQKAKSEADAARDRLATAREELAIQQRAAAARVRTSRDGYNPNTDFRVVAARNAVEQAEKQVAIATRQSDLARKQLNETEAAADTESAEHAQAIALQTIAREAEAAATEKGNAALEARLKLLPLEERIKEAQNAAVANSPELKNIKNAELRAAAEQQVRQAVEDRIRAEVLGKTKTEDKTAADGKAERAARQLAKQTEAVTEAVLEIARQAEDYEDQMGLVDQVTESTTRRTRQLERSVADATRTIKESTMADEDKAAALAQMETNADRAAKAIADLDAKERARQERSAREGLGDFYGQTRRDSMEGDYDWRGLMDMELDRAARDSRDSREQYEESMGREMTPEEAAAHQAMLEESWFNIERSYGLHIDRMKEFNEGFRENSERMLGTSIRMALDGDFKSIADAWKSMLKDMVAQLIQSKLLDLIKGQQSSSGGGFLSMLGSLVGSFFGMGAGKVSGSSVGTINTGSNFGTYAASGGLITGPGTDVSDSIPAWLSDGEFVIKASAARSVGLDFLHALNAGKLAPSRKSSFASGGAVGRVVAGGGVEGGGGDIVLNITNYGNGNEVTSRHRRNGSQEEIDMFIGKAAESVRENGALGQAITSTFTVGKKGVRRG